MVALTVGDEVTVYRKVNKEYWVGTMDKLIGLSGVIIRIHGDSFFIDLGAGREYYIPKTAVKRYEEEN